MIFDVIAFDMNASMLTAALSTLNKLSAYCSGPCNMNTSQSQRRLEVGTDDAVYLCEVGFQQCFTALNISWVNIG